MKKYLIELSENEMLRLINLLHDKANDNTSILNDEFKDLEKKFRTIYQN